MLLKKGVCFIMIIFESVVVDMGYVYCFSKGKLLWNFFDVDFFWNEIYGDEWYNYFWLLFYFFRR